MEARPLMRSRSMVRGLLAGLSMMVVSRVSTAGRWEEVLWLEMVLPLSSQHQMMMAPTLSNWTL